MRTLLGAGLILATACGLAAGQEKKDEKIDPAKLVGKWEQMTDVKDIPKVTMEFTADGKLTADFGSAMPKAEGTYKLADNKLTQTLKINGKDVTQTYTITKLTDDVMEGEDAGQKFKRTRVKDKKGG